MAGEKGKKTQGQCSILYTTLGYRIDGETDDGKQHTMRLLFEER